MDTNLGQQAEVLLARISPSPYSEVLGRKSVVSLHRFVLRFNERWKLLAQNQNAVVRKHSLLSVLVVVCLVLLLLCKEKPVSLSTTSS